MVSLSNHQPNGGGEGWLLRTIWTKTEPILKKNGLFCFRLAPYRLCLKVRKVRAGFISAGWEEVAKGPVATRPDKEIMDR